MIPYLEEQVNERAVSHMSETMEQMRQNLWKYVESETTRYAARCIKVSKGPNEEVLLKQEFILVPEALRPMCFANLYARRPGGAKTLSRSMQRCCLNCWITKWDARRGPYGIVAVRIYEGIEPSLGETRDA